MGHSYVLQEYPSFQATRTQSGRRAPCCNVCGPCYLAGAWIILALKEHGGKLHPIDSANDAPENQHAVHLGLICWCQMGSAKFAGSESPWPKARRKCGRSLGGQTCQAMPRSCREAHAPMLHSIDHACAPWSFHPTNA